VGQEIIWECDPNRWPYYWDVIGILLWETCRRRKIRNRKTQPL